MFNQRLIQTAFFAAALTGVAVAARPEGKGDGKGKKKKPTSSCGDATMYPEFANEIATQGDDLCWQAYEVQTRDGYNLTLFNIAGLETASDIPDGGALGPLVFMHGFSTDSITWWNRSDTSQVAVGVQLALEGYDVFFTNYRGTRYSRTNASLDANNDAAYWNFNFEDIAAMDVPAFVEKIVEVSGTCKKVTLVGHSQGGQNAIFSTALASNASDYIAQIVALAPCIVANTDQFYPGLNEATYADLSSGLNLLGYESLFGPNWNSQLSFLCFLLGSDSTECQILRSVELASSTNTFGTQEICVKQTEHLAQNRLQNSFQEFTSSYFTGSKLTTPYDLTSINVPVRYMWMEQDTLCPEAYQKTWTNTILTNSGEQKLNRDHGAASGANDAEFMTALRALLVDQGDMIDEAICAAPFNW